MLDLLLRGARLPGELETRDIGIKDGLISELEPESRQSIELGDQITLQLVAFPQQGIMSFDDGENLMRKAIDLGVDVVGAIPHFELTREYGEQSIKFAFALAA